MAKLAVTDREGRQVEIDGQTGMTLMENIRDLDDSVDAICGGLCSCATCHVHIDPEWFAELPPRHDEEDLLVSESEYFDAGRSRLSCQIVLTDELDGLTLTVAPEEF